MYTTPYINGAPIEVPPAALADVVNPATQRPFAKVFMAQPDHMHRAIDAAYAAKDAWGHTLAAERELILQCAADVLEKARTEVVDLLIDEAGSTFGKAQFEVSFTVNMLRAVSGEARRIQGDVIPSDVPGMMSIAIRRPLGVVAGIAPFNFPLLLATKKVCLALAAGNTFVLKPSEETSLIGLKIAEIFQKAGLPAGALNVVPGDGPTVGPVLFADPRVRLISFTGSTAVAAHRGRVSKHGKKVILELEERARLSCLKTPIWIMRSQPLASASSFTKGKSAWRARALLLSLRFTVRSSNASWRK